MLYKSFSKILANDHREVENKNPSKIVKKNKFRQNNIKNPRITFFGIKILLEKPLVF